MTKTPKLIALKRQAQKEGWAKFIRTPVDEKALLAGHSFSWDAYDHFRFFAENFVVLKKTRKPGPFEILDFQELIFGSLFGWQRPDGLRRFRRGYIERAKKNSKTTDSAIIGLYMLIADGEPSPEVYNAANDRKQAALLWDIAAEIVEESPELKKRVKILRSVKRLLIGTDAWFDAWSSDATTKDGPNIHCCICDELHEWKGNSAREFWRKIRYGGIARAQPLCPLVITTAGDDRHSLCYEQHTYAKRILDGNAEDLAYFASIDAVDPEKIRNDPDYWKSEEAWKQANPGYGIILRKEDFQEDVVACENDPAEKAAFLRYRLSYWIESDTPWLPSHVWAANAGPGFTEDELRGRVCYAGMDLSSVDDFTAVTYTFPVMDGDVKKYRVIARIFCPEDTLHDRARKLDVDIRVWVEQGYITPTPGNCIDHEFIWEQIKADAEIFQIVNLGYDRWSAAWIIKQIQDYLAHIEPYPVNQSLVGLSNATKALTMALKQERIEHNGNPVLSWMAANAVPHFDAKENMMLHKGRSKDKIDGIIALVMAFGQAELGDLFVKKKASIYSDENFKQAMKQLEGIDIDN